MASSTSAHNRSLSDTGHQRLTSLTSRQRRMGPAPLASFEEVSMDRTDSSPEGIIPLPKIGEELSSVGTKEGLDVPTSPRIRVSAASSPSQNDSKESTPEKEHFTGYTKAEFCDIEMADIRSSTEELDAESQERARKQRARSLMLEERDKREEALKIRELMRKGSASSVISDSLLPVTSGHSSRLSSLGSIGSPRRSPSPHKMLLETSFCGSKPIQQPSIDIEDPPIEAASTIHQTIERLEDIRSPFEAKPPDIFRSISPITDRTRLEEKENIINDTEKEFEVSPKPSRPLESSKLKQELAKSLQRRQEQQRRQAEHHEYQQRLVDQAELIDKKMVINIHQDRRNIEDNFEERFYSSERQSRLEKRSPRLGKKVPTPQIPGISPNSEDSRYSRSTKSFTPPGSPKSSKKAKRFKGHESGDPSATLPARKSSFSSLFKKTDAVSSPVTPDSPGSSGSGRKSPFSQLIKNAEIKLKSKSRSRSHSKDRDPEDDINDKRSKLSIFAPAKRKKTENGRQDADEIRYDNSDTKLIDPITNVEFKFHTKEAQPGIGKEINESIQTEALANGQHARLEREDSLTKLSSLMSEANRTGSITENFSEEVTTSLREKEKEILGQSEQFLEAREKIGQFFAKENSWRMPSPTPSGPSSSLVVKHDQEADSLSISESEKVSEVDYLKKKERAATKAESPDTEIKGLVSQDSFEDGELPYVPTTLPQERSTAAPMIPVNQRAPKLKMTQSIDRPRSTTPIQPSKLEEYKQSSQEMLDQDFDKMTISIKVPAPGAIKVLPAAKGPKRQDSKSWEDFCNEGLKSPRQIRRQIKEKQQSSEESNPPVVPEAPKPPPIKPVVSVKDSASTVRQPGTRNWINFDEIPDIVLKPVRQIKTIPPKQQFPIYSLPKKRQEVKQAFEKAPSAEKESDKESSAHSSESEDEKHTSISSSEELNTVRDTIDELKKQSTEESLENSDLERLLAPVNECITKLSSLTAQSESAHMADSRKSPIPDNWEDFLLPPQPGRRSRLSSIGSEAGSLGGLSLRSPSPSALLLETSFCGSQPIDDPALEEPDMPIPMARKLSGISLGDLSPITPRAERGSSVHSAQYLSHPDRSSLVR